MIERKNERKIEERISWKETSRILYTFPSLTPYVDFCYSFVYTYTHTHTHSLSYMRYFMSPGNNYSHNNINCRRWPTLFFSILLLPLELLLLFLPPVPIHTQIVRHTLAFYNINFHLFSLVFCHIFAIVVLVTRPCSLPS